MEHNHINNHICNNNTKRMERNYCGRYENEMMPRRENNYDCEGNRLYEHLKYYENNERSYCNRCDQKCKNEHGGEVYFLNVEKCAYQNNNFKESIWTGEFLQLTLMSIPCSKNIGAEVHDDTDQYIRVESGYAVVLTGENCKCLNNRMKLCKGDAVLIPAGVWHDIVNVGKRELKISSVYAPSHHPKCTEQRYKNNNY